MSDHAPPFSASPRPTLAHRLGNLVLLPPKLNSQLQALDPQKKADAYVKSGLLIAQEVAGQLNKPWKRPSIDERRKVARMGSGGMGQVSRTGRDQPAIDSTSGFTGAYVFT